MSVYVCDEQFISFSLFQIAVMMRERDSLITIMLIYLMIWLPQVYHQWHNIKQCIDWAINENNYYIKWKGYASLRAQWYTFSITTKLAHTHTHAWIYDQILDARFWPMCAQYGTRYAHAKTDELSWDFILFWVAKFNRKPHTSNANDTCFTCDYNIHFMESRARVRAYARDRSIRNESQLYNIYFNYLLRARKRPNRGQHCQYESLTMHYWISRFEKFTLPVWLVCDLRSQCVNQHYNSR